MRTVILPKVRGFICTTAHPVGCYKNILDQVNYAKKFQTGGKAPKNILIIGSSTGYGLSSRIATSFLNYNSKKTSDIKTIGVCFEKPPVASNNRSGSPGWYNTAAFENIAKEHGLYAKTFNGDAFSNEIKEQVCATALQDFPEKIDLVVYSVAAPRRKDPNTGEIFNSVLKPINNKYSNKSVDFITGKVSDIEILPATPDEITATTKVMGGEDWQLWIDALISKNLLAENAKTIAYSYIGPEITHPIYRNGTIGIAKADLEKTSIKLNTMLQKHCNGNAYVSINKGLVTQASSAIPVVPLYISLIYKIMQQQGTHEGCIEQMVRLMRDKLYTKDSKAVLDSNALIRMDDWEMADSVQNAVTNCWDKISTESLADLVDLESYKKDFYQLFGFSRSDVNYEAEVETQVTIPSIDIVSEFI